MHRKIPKVPIQRRQGILSPFGGISRNFRLCPKLSNQQLSDRCYDETV
jgi:hypothetical protein